MITAEQREAAKLIRAMQPLIEAHFRALPPTPPAPPPPPPTLYEQNMEAACKQVGDAVDRLEQVKFTAAEVRARVALEQAARRLRALMVAKARSRRGN